MPKRWNVDVRLTSTGLTKLGSPDLKPKPGANPYLEANVENLEPTESEREAMTAAVDELSKLVQRLGLPDIRVPLERIHVISKEEFQNRISEHAFGKTTFGHVYIPRFEDQVEFCQILTHELAHAGSYYGVRAIMHHDERRLQVRERRAGITAQPKPGADAAIYFNGLNEGITELVAAIFRNKLSKKLVELDDDEREALAKTREYPHWVILVEALLRLAAQESEQPIKSVREELLQDYFSGTFKFLKRLERCKPGVVRALRTAGSSPADALKTAEAFDLTEAQKAILELGTYRGERKLI